MCVCVRFFFGGEPVDGFGRFSRQKRTPTPISGVPQALVVPCLDQVPGAVASVACQRGRDGVHKNQQNDDAWHV